MRDSTTRLIIGMLVVMIIGLLMLLLFQTAWLKMIMFMLNSNQSAGLPVSSTPITGFSFPTARPPAPSGVELTVGNLGITVTNVLLPADNYVGNAARYTALDKGEQYLLVGIRVRCVSSKEKCHLTEFDFGVESNAGHDYPAELSGNFDLKGLFDGGDIQPRGNLNGSLIFIVQKGESGLTLVYPRMFGFGSSAKFSLGK